MSTKNVYVICRADNSSKPLKTQVWFQNRFVCKIGIADNPIERLNNLQTANPFNLGLFANIKTDNPKHLEKVLHKLYSKFNRQELNKQITLNGEWYYISELELSLLNTINNMEVSGVDNSIEPTDTDKSNSQIINLLELIEKNTRGLR